MLPLWEPNEELDFSNLDFQFDLIVASEGEVDPKPCSLEQFEQEERALVVDDVHRPHTRYLLVNDLLAPNSCTPLTSC